ncbi:hypothetical protein GWI33_013809 [Rhynchophorus ferrugineus]|uniref:RING-type domain-containing protein n=1 Tax=Rhynchophorus ferrugineus TaxID=354439 RepID=A0A834I8I2_RHYFE|nr:hypothetical protein GWI33_013809 [Rhynchophorus ferrugineus]
MNNWVFCNRCLGKYTNKVSTRKYFLSECGHIFCGDCMRKIIETKKCEICKTPAAFMELSAEMDFTKQLFFWPMENILQQSIRIFDFQNMHRKLYLKCLENKYNYLKKQCLTYYNTYKKLQKENQTLRENLTMVGLKSSPFLSSTPAMDRNHQMCDDLSAISSIRAGTPASIPGSAKRIFPYDMSRKFMATSATNSSLNPSPAQTVPRSSVAPVHRNLVSSTPSFMSKQAVKSRIPLIYPRK